MTISIDLLKPILDALAVLGLVIALDLICGVVVAIKQRAFRWDKLADFIGDYAPKVLGWLALKAISFLPTDIQALAGAGPLVADGAYLLILASALASTLGHIQGMGLPLNLPGVPPTNKAKG